MVIGVGGGQIVLQTVARRDVGDPDIEPFLVRHGHVTADMAAIHIHLDHMIARRQDTANDKGTRAIDRHVFAHHLHGAPRSRAGSGGGDAAPAHRNVAQAGVVLALARSKDVANRVMGVKATFRADQIARRGFIVTPGTIIDPQHIGQIARSVGRHGPVDAAIRTCGKYRHHGTSARGAVDDADFRPRDKGRIIGRTAETNGFTRPESGPQVGGGDIQHSAQIKPVIAHVDIGIGGGNVGLAAWIDGCRGTCNGLPVDRDRKAAASKVATGPRVDPLGILTGGHIDRDVAIGSAAILGLRHQRLIAVSVIGLDRCSRQKQDQGGGTLGNGQSAEAGATESVKHAHNPFTRPTAEWSFRPSVSHAPHRAILRGCVFPPVASRPLRA